MASPEKGDLHGTDDYQLEGRDDPEIIHSRQAVSVIDTTDQNEEESQLSLLVEQPSTNKYDAPLTDDDFVFIEESNPTTNTRLLNKLGSANDDILLSSFEANDTSQMADCPPLLSTSPSPPLLSTSSSFYVASLDNNPDYFSPESSSAQVQHVLLLGNDSPSVSEPMKLVTAKNNNDDPVLLSHDFYSESGNEKSPVVQIHSPTSSSTQVHKRKRTRLPVSNSKMWSREENKQKRLKGESYIGYRRKDKKCKKIMIHDSPKESKRMGPVCPISSNCAKWPNRKCHEIDEEKRLRLFTEFWKNMDWGEKKFFIASLVDATHPKQKSHKGPDSARSVSYSYHLKIENDRVPVCQKTFLNTFGLKNSTVRYWLADYNDIGCSSKTRSTGKNGAHQSGSEDDEKLVIGDNEETLKGRREANTQRPQQTKQTTNKTIITSRNQHLDTFLEGIPKIPSHHCRKSTNRIYLQTDISSMTKLFHLYTEECKENNSVPLSRFTFDRRCKLKRLSIYKPKKDRCDLCEGYKYGNVSKETYEKHFQLKELARVEKEKDKVMGEEGKAYVLNCDVMAVQVLPLIDVSSAYYKMKLCIHNYTVYNLANNDAICFWFTETETSLVSSAFATCLINEINRLLDENGKKEVIVYSDGCTYQNRNCVLSNALLSLSVERDVVIHQKFLEKGHTEMEGDSVHSAVETRIKEKRNGVFLPHQMVEITKEARKSQPYRSKLMYHNDFKDYSAPASLRYSSIRPGSKTNDPVVTDLRWLKYDPKGIIYYKINFSDDFHPLPRRPNQVFVDEFPQLHTAELPIPKDKWDDLQSLKISIPKDCHSFYDRLPHSDVSYKKTVGRDKKKRGLLETTAGEYQRGGEETTVAPSANATSKNKRKKTTAAPSANATSMNKRKKTTTAPSANATSMNKRKKTTAAPSANATSKNKRKKTTAAPSANATLKNERKKTTAAPSANAKLRNKIKKTDDKD